MAALHRQWQRFWLASKVPTWGSEEKKKKKKKKKKKMGAEQGVGDARGF